MFNKISKYCFVLIFVGFLASCTGSPFYHENFMRGQVVGVDNNEVVICIGSKDGAKKGQALSAYRVEYNESTEEGDDVLSREYIGEVVIDSIINEHFARASISTGSVMKYDIVELKK
tara:strand:- start:5407 stop:5757 length:351 start_codon:yes stop_codon:yes gene_type:complete